MLTSCICDEAASRLPRPAVTRAGSTRRSAHVRTPRRGCAMRANYRYHAAGEAALAGVIRGRRALYGAGLPAAATAAIWVGVDRAIVHAARRRVAMTAGAPVSNAQQAIDIVKACRPHGDEAAPSRLPRGTSSGSNSISSALIRNEPWAGGRARTARACLDRPMVPRRALRQCGGRGVACETEDARRAGDERVRGDTDPARVQ